MMHIICDWHLYNHVLALSRLLRKNPLNLIFSIGLTRLKGILKHLKDEGMSPKMKKSGGRHNNKRAHNIDDIDRANKFLDNYRSTHGLLLPGHTPGYRRVVYWCCHPARLTSRFTHHIARPVMDNVFYGLIANNNLLRNSNSLSFLDNEIYFIILFFISLWVWVRTMSLTSFEDMWRDLLP